MAKSRLTAHSWRLCVICLLSLSLSLFYVAVQQGVLSTRFAPIEAPSRFLHELPLVSHPPDDEDFGSLPPPPPPIPLVKYQKPKNIKIIGLVFFGRKETVEILNCYLQRNLVDNGGFLDEIVFAVKTDKKNDLKYLEELLAANPKYSKHQSKSDRGSWIDSWESVKGKDIYIKIDDDVVYFEDITIPAIVRRMIENPHYFSVSANIVNNPALAWVHYSSGAMEPYLPEPKAPASNPIQPTWRASLLPSWTGPRSFKFNSTINAGTYPNHRWLPLPPSFDIDDTPATAITQWSHKGGLLDWGVAAQTHYSFLSRLEKDELYKYKFDLLDYHYQRISINFLGFWGKDIKAAFPFKTDDDEEYLSVTRPKELKRHLVIEGSGIAVHFAFGPQRAAHGEKGLLNTDLLSRYKAYANEMICPR